jgi:uncharacterized FAD-dependent dehydrogenase
MGIAPNGFTMGNNARNVAKAAEGKARRMFCMALAGFIVEEAYQWDGISKRLQRK